LNQLNSKVGEKSWVGGWGSRRGKFNLNKKFSQHYEKISKLLKDPEFQKLGKAGIFLGARFGALTNECDNCKTSLNNYMVVVMKPVQPRHYCTVHVLCNSCRLIHANEVKYYLYLNK